MCAHLPDADLPRIAAASSIFPQVFWKDDQAGDSWLGLGEIDAVVAEGREAAYAAPDRCRERLLRAEAPADWRAMARYIGGIAFDPGAPGRRGAGQWTPAAAGSRRGAARFVLPRILLRRREGSGSIEAAISLPAGEARGEALASALRDLARGAAFDPARSGPVGAGAGSAGARGHSDGVQGGALRLRAAHRADALRVAWVERVREAIAAIERGDIGKLVLSRRAAFRILPPTGAWSLVRRLAAADRDPVGCRAGGVVACFRFDRSEAFIAATPERLLVQRGDDIEIDCLAGTALRGASDVEGIEAARLLLASDKDRREHAIVLEAIVAALRPSCTSVSVSEAVELRRLPGLLHLSTPVRARLAPGAALGSLLERLHPTPAVGGFPRDAALERIAALEGRSRGWYAGAIGWIGPEDAALAVAIRSARVIAGGRGLVVHAGAGIVAGSDPAAEWEETEAKIASFLSLLGAERA